MDTTPLPPEVVFDGHNDTLMDVFMPEPGKERSLLERSDRGHVDLPRAREAGYGGGFFAICVPPESREHPDFASFVTENGYDVPLPPPLDQAYAHQVTASAIDCLFRLEAESGGRLKVARAVDDIVACLQQAVVAAALHLEGADALDCSLDALHEFHALGLRSIGIVWSRPNAFGCGVPFRFPGTPDSGTGLTERGKELVRECNRLGVMLDLAHLNERGFWNVAALSDAPLVVTHAGVHAICPSTRNLTDKQLDAIGESNGIVGVAFHVGFLRADGGPQPDTPLTEIVRHIDYIADRIGVDCVALGSDFDGAVVPLELRDVTGLPKLIEALCSSGYDDEALRKVTHENWLRVLHKTWKR